MDTGIDTNENYWFFIEPYVFLSLIGESLFLYNTLDGNRIDTANATAIKLLEPIVRNQETTVLLAGSLLHADKALSDFVSELREKFMGDLIEVSLTRNRPIQLSPILNIQNSIERLKSNEDRSIGENLMNHLHEVTIFLKNPSSFPNKYFPTSVGAQYFEAIGPQVDLDLETIRLFLNQLPPRDDIFVTVIIDDPSGYKDWGDLRIYLNELPFRKKYVCRNNPNFSGDNSLVPLEEHSHLELVVDPATSSGPIKLLLSHIKGTDIKLSFNIYREQDVQWANDIIADNTDIEYHFTPIFDGSNIDFFEENVFLTEEDIFSSPISMRQIFINQSINIESFGKLSVTPHGNVYSGIFGSSIGNIKETSVSNLIYSELESGISWFNVRNSPVCKECHYRWLCPTPSNYEEIMKKEPRCLLGKFK